MDTESIFVLDLRYVDLNDIPVKKKKEDYPYSYDPFVVWKGDYNENKGDMVYSDRLIQWDRTKFENCCLKIWGNQGQNFYDRKPKEIEQFLSLYLNKKLVLTAIMEGCNVSNGFPIWMFYYEIIEE